MTNLPILAIESDTKELSDSIGMFYAPQQPAPSFLKGMARDAVAQIEFESDDLFDEIIIHQPLCNACTVNEKCVQHFRGNRQGCLADEFDSLFLGQFRTNLNH